MSDTSNAEFAANEGLTAVGDGLADASNLSDADAFGPDVSSEESVVEPLFEVDGTPITLDEARNGYLRQSDYTRKTQELAEMRARLAEAEAITAALQNDPANTIKALQDAFGVGVEQDYGMDSYEETDPELARIAALERKIAAQEQAATQAMIQSELNGLHEQFGDFDDSVLFAHAIKGGFPNLRAAYADMNFTNLQSELTSLKSAKAQEEERMQAKRAAAGKVHTGASRAGATQALPEQYSSIREAYLAAKKALNA